MKLFKYRQLTASLIAASMVTSTLSGCVSPAQIAGSKTAAANTLVKSDQAQDEFLQRIHREKAAVEAEEDVDKPYLVGTPVMLSRDATLPLALRKNVTTLLDFKANSKSHLVSLETAVQALSVATGIPFRIDPDVYLPPAMLLPKSFATTGGAMTAAKPIQASKPAPFPGLDSPLPSGLRSLALDSAAGSDDRGSLMVEIPDDKPHPASEIADLFANRLGISWEYDPAKRMGRFFRLVTKTYQVPVGSGKRAFTNEFKSSTQQINAGAGGMVNTDPETQVKLTNNDTIVALQNIANQLTPVLTKASSLAINDDTGTITLTDTKEAVEKADAIIKGQVAILSKLISLNFQTVQVTVNDNGQAGVNWNAVIQGALRNVPGLNLGTSPASLVAGTAGSAGFSILSGAFAGTTAVVNALNEIGNASSSISVPLTLRNRRPATYDTSNLFYFLSGSSGAVGAVGGSGGVPGYTLSSGSVGFKLFIYPDADDDNDVNLSLAFDNSVLNSITPVTTGSGVNQQTFQEPNINRNGVGGQEVSIHNGQTMLITGFDQTNNQYDRRSMGARIPLILGGSLTATHTRTFTLVFVTVSIQDQGFGS